MGTYGNGKFPLSCYIIRDKLYITCIYYTEQEDYNPIVHGYVIDIPLSTSGNILPSNNNVITTYNQQDHTISMDDITYDINLKFFLNGNGDKYLADDGTYKAISIPAATTTTIGGITEPDETNYFGDTFVDGLNGTVLATTSPTTDCPFTLQWDGDDGISTATYSVDDSSQTNTLNLVDNLVAKGTHELGQKISTVTTDLNLNKFCIGYSESSEATATRKFIYGQNSPFQQTEAINSSAITACLAGSNNASWFYTLPGSDSSVHIYNSNEQDTTINVNSYCAILGSIPICFDYTNELFLAIDFNIFENKYILVKYNTSNNTKTTIVDITNYLNQADDVFPVNLFFSGNALHILATTPQFNTFVVMNFQYSSGNVTYTGYIPLGTTLSDPVSVVQINFIKNSYWRDTALLYYRKSAKKWFYWYANNSDALENTIMQEDSFCVQVNNGSMLKWSDGSKIIGNLPDISNMNIVFDSKNNNLIKDYSQHLQKPLYFGRNTNNDWTPVYIDSTGGTSAPSYTLPTASSSALGGIKIGFTESGKNYPVELNSNGQAYVNVPWTDTNTVYTLPTASNSTKGGITTNYSQTANNRAVKVSGTNAYVNIPTASTSSAGLMSTTMVSKLNGIDSNANNYTLPVATTSSLGGIKVSSDSNTSNVNNNIPVCISNNLAYVPIQQINPGQSLPSLPTQRNVALNNDMFKMFAASDLYNSDIAVQFSVLIAYYIPIARGSASCTILKTWNNYHADNGEGTGLSVNNTVYDAIRLNNNVGTNGIGDVSYLNSTKLISFRLYCNSTRYTNLNNTFFRYTSLGSSFNVNFRVSTLNISDSTSTDSYAVLQLQANDNETKNISGKAIITVIYMK